jgi:MFS family permease
VNVSIESGAAALGGPADSRLRRTLGAFRNYNFRLYFSGQLISQVGAWMQKIGQAWLVLQITHSPIALGTVAALQFLPILCGSLFASVLVDRVPKHRLLLVTQTLALVQAVVLAGLTVTGYIQLWHIYLLALFLGIVNALDSPARLAFIMELVGRENVVNAVGLNSAMNNGARLFGPALAGVTIAIWGVGNCFVLNAISFLAVVIGLALMRPAEFQAVPERAEQRKNVASEMGEGLRYIWGRPELVMVTISMAGLGTFGYNYNTVVPLLAESALHLGPDGFGLLMTAVGLGALIGAIGVASGGRRPSSRRLLVAGAGFALAQVAVSVAPGFASAFALLAVMALCSMLFATSSNSILQLGSPDHLRGRVMGIYSTLLVGTTPIGSMLTGFMAAAFGIRETMATWGTLCLLIVGLAALYGVRNGLIEMPRRFAQPFRGRPDSVAPAALSDLQGRPTL